MPIRRRNALDGVHVQHGGPLRELLEAYQLLECAMGLQPSKEELRTFFGWLHRWPSERAIKVRQLVRDNFEFYLDNLCELGYYLEFREMTGYEAFMHLF
jgi:hypothetical protein